MASIILRWLWQSRVVAHSSVSVAVIKSTNSTRLLKDAIVLDMGDLGRHAERMIAAAEEEATRIRAEARQQADAMIAAADAQGFEQGRERGAAEGHQLGFESGRTEAIQLYSERLEKLSIRWIEAIERWDQDRQRMLDEAREDVIRFAIELGRKVVYRMASGDPTIIQDQLRESLALLLRPSALCITVHPDDRRLAEEVVAQLVSAIGASAHASLQEDPLIERGGCLIATGSGHIDATLRTQLDRLARALVPDAAAASTDGVSGS